MDSLIFFVVIYFIIKTLKTANKAYEKGSSSRSATSSKNLAKPKKSFWQEIQDELKDLDDDKADGNFWEDLQKKLNVEDTTQKHKPKKNIKPKKDIRPKKVENLEKPATSTAYEPLKARISHRMQDIADKSGSIKEQSTEGTASSEGTGSDVCVFDNQHSPIDEPRSAADGIFASISANDLVKGVIMSEMLNRKYE